MDFAVFCAQIRDQQAPKATVTVYLKRLEAAGFVRREIEPSDRRRHRLLLTPARVSSHHGRPCAAIERIQRASWTPHRRVAQGTQEPARTNSVTACCA